MGVYESSAIIKKGVKDLNVFWEQTKGVWKDAKSRQFEEEFITRLSLEARNTQKALDNIGPLLNRIQSELRD